MIIQPLWIPSGVPRRGCSIFFVLTLCLSLQQTPINWSPRGLYLSEFTQIIWVSQFRYLSPLGDNFELFGQIFKYFIEETTKNQPGTNLGQLKNRFLRQIETPGWPIFDQVGRPSRLVLGKKFFWIWFIYALEGIVLASQFFFLTKCHIWNTLIFTASSCVVDSSSSICFLSFRSPFPLSPSWISSISPGLYLTTTGEQALSSFPLPPFRSRLFDIPLFTIMRLEAIET